LLGSSDRHRRRDAHDLRVTNRVLIRKAPKTPSASTTASAPRELLTASVTQSYYTDQQASAFDPAYNSSYVDAGSVRPLSNYSPVALNVRSQASQMLATTLRMEYDWPTKKMLTISTGGNFVTPKTSVSVAGAAASAFYPTNAFRRLVAGERARRRLTGDHQIAPGISSRSGSSASIVAAYNAQCCGIVMEYQEYNFGNFGGTAAIPKDRRYNIGFTLAGVGTCANFFGNFGGSGGGR
jgi:hypothetical protein